MRPEFKTMLLALILLVYAEVAVAQEQQPPPNEPQPQVSSPNQPAPKDTAPQTTEPQPGASNAAAPESPAGKDQTPQEQPPAAQNRPPSKSTLKTSGTVGKKSAKASPGKAHHATRHKRVTDPSGKVVVRNGGARDDSIQLSPAGNQQDSQDRKNTDQLLSRADENLKRVAGQQLTATQQSTVDQIRTYMRQAKSAADAGDLARAHTLALKAHLLSVDLTKH